MEWACLLVCSGESNLVCLKPLRITKVNLNGCFIYSVIWHFVVELQVQKMGCFFYRKWSVIYTQQFIRSKWHPFISSRNRMCGYCCKLKMQKKGETIQLIMSVRLCMRVCVMNTNTNYGHAFYIECIAWLINLYTKSQYMCEIKKKSTASASLLYFHQNIQNIFRKRWKGGVVTPKTLGHHDMFTPHI